MDQKTKLRISVGRIAQRLGLDDFIPGDGMGRRQNYEQLTYSAQHNDRGWNLLCAHIIDAVPNKERK